MPARNVDELWLTNWQATGQSVPVTQYSVHVKLVWTDADGEQHVWEGDKLFPNVLDGLPAARQKELAQDIAVELARLELGIDE